MNKRGELTSAQLITIIILIVSFVVILVFFFIFNFKSETAIESCRNSVSLRATEFGKSVKLDCKTQDVCLNAGGDCGYTSKDVVNKKATNKTAAIKEIADLMYDCWWMMGQGKVDYAPKGIGFTEKYCNICNEVRFDDRLQKSGEKITLEELYNYLAITKSPNGKESYLQNLYGLPSLEAVRAIIRDNTQIEGGNGGVDILAQEIDLTKKYALVTSITKQGYGTTIIAGSVGAAVGIAIAAGSAGTGSLAIPTSFATAAKLTTTVLGIIGTSQKFAVGGAGIGLFITSNGNQYIPPTIYEFTEGNMQELNCKSFTSQSA